MILWVFIEFFGVKIVITDIYRYLPIFYRHLPIFYRYFTDIFLEILAQEHVLHSLDFLVEKSVIFPDFSSDRFSLCFFFLVPVENRFFDDISIEKKRFFIPWLKVSLFVLLYFFIIINFFFYFRRC